MKLKNWKLRGGSFTSQRGAVRTMLIASAVAITSSLAVAAPKGELVVINWTPGSERESIVALEKAFMAKYPDVKIREISVTWTGDARGAIRTILLGGEKADLLINTWPAFRKELAEGGFLRPLDNVWATNQWDTKLSQSWKDIGSVGDKVLRSPIQLWESKWALVSHRHAQESWCVRNTKDLEGIYRVAGKTQKSRCYSTCRSGKSLGACRDIRDATIAFGWNGRLGKIS